MPLKNKSFLFEYKPLQSWNNTLPFVFNCFMLENKSSPSRYKTLPSWNKSLRSRYKNNIIKHKHLIFNYLFIFSFI